MMSADEFDGPSCERCHAQPAGTCECDGSQRWDVIRSVPWSQVHPGSRGGERGRLHLQRMSAAFSSGRLTRCPGQLLCGRTPWHSVGARVQDDEQRCVSCADFAVRYGIQWPTIPQLLTDDARRALAHITGRTISGGFACCFHDWEPERWQDALRVLGLRGYIIRFTHGRVADEPTVTGGCVLDAPYVVSVAGFPPRKALAWTAEGARDAAAEFVEQRMAPYMDAENAQEAGMPDELERLLKQAYALPPAGGLIRLLDNATITVGRPR